MKKIALLSVIALFITATFSSCGKYEEGPGFSILTKKMRLSQEWILTKTIYSSNIELEADENNNIVVSFDKDGTSETAFTFVGLTTNYDGTWAFDGDVNLILSDDFGILGVSTDTLEIIRLSKDELTLKDSDGDYTYYVPNK